MTDLDTTAFRRALAADEMSVTDVDALLDAIDAARADVDMARDCEWAAQVRAEAREARIAAALDALAMTGYATKDEMESAVRRALTGDTP